MRFPARCCGKSAGWPACRCSCLQTGPTCPAARRSAICRATRCRSRWPTSAWRSSGCTARWRPPPPRCRGDGADGGAVLYRPPAVPGRRAVHAGGAGMTLGRYAPSPSGRMHLATSAAACWPGFRPSGRAAGWCCGSKTLTRSAARGSLPTCLKPTLPGSGFRLTRAARPAAPTLPITKASGRLCTKPRLRAWPKRTCSTRVFAAGTNCTRPARRIWPTGRCSTPAPAET